MDLDWGGGLGRDVVGGWGIVRLWALWGCGGLVKRKWNGLKECLNGNWELQRENAQIFGVWGDEETDQLNTPNLK